MRPRHVQELLSWPLVVDDTNSFLHERAGQNLSSCKRQFKNSTCAATELSSKVPPTGRQRVIQLAGAPGAPVSGCKGSDNSREKQSVQLSDSLHPSQWPHVVLTCTRGHAALALELWREVVPEMPQNLTNITPETCETDPNLSRASSSLM